MEKGKKVIQWLGGRSPVLFLSYPSGWLTGELWKRKVIYGVREPKAEINIVRSRRGRNQRQQPGNKGQETGFIFFPMARTKLTRSLAGRDHHLIPWVEKALSVQNGIDLGRDESWTELIHNLLSQQPFDLVPFNVRPGKDRDVLTLLMPSLESWALPLPPTLLPSNLQVTSRNASSIAVNMCISFPSQSFLWPLFYGTVFGFSCLSNIPPPF